MKIELKTKFDLKDIVWTMDGSYPRRGIILGISYKTDRSVYSANPEEEPNEESKLVYLVRIGDAKQQRCEWQLAKTAKELRDNVFEEAIRHDTKKDQ